MEKKVLFKNSRGLTLVGDLFIPEKHSHSIAILCHGHRTSRKGRTIKSMVKTIFSSRLIVFTFDFTGHGESEGDVELTTLTHARDDVKAAILLLKEKFPDYKIGLFGSSFGGAACIGATNTDISTLVLSSSAIDYHSKSQRIAKANNTSLKEWEKIGTITDSSKRHYFYYKDAMAHNLYKKAKIIKIPTLVIAGDLDKEVLIAETKKFYENLSGVKQLKIFKNTGHRRNDEQIEITTKLMVGWFNKYLK